MERPSGESLKASKGFPVPRRRVKPKKVKLREGLARG